MASVTTSGFDLFDRTMRDLGGKVDNAAKATLRAAAKTVVTEARAHVRVYAGAREDVPKGRLKRSIKASTVKRRSPGLWQVTVAPAGYPAWAYAGQIEELEPFMDPASKVADVALPTLAFAALAKVMDF